MHMFTDSVSASPDIAPFAKGLARDGELKELYEDWEILRFKSYVFEDEHPNVPKHLHSAIRSWRAVYDLVGIVERFSRDRTNFKIYMKGSVLC